MAVQAHFWRKVRRPNLDVPHFLLYTVQIMDDKIPAYYMICLNSACPQAENCLRQLYAMHYPADAVSVRALNPRLYPKGSGECEHYRPMKKIHLAWGIKDMLRDIPYDRARSIRRDMISHFGKTRYYRFFREEIPLTPAEQSAVQNIFRNNGVDTAPAYNRHSEEIDWE